MTITIKETAKLHHATLAKANKLADMLAAEYPALTLEPAYNEDDSRVTGWVVMAGEEAIYDGEKVPEIADLLDICEDMGIDPEEGAEEEEGSGGSVVPEVYRAAYREQSSNGQTCGDWLAEFLTGQCHGIDGFNTHDFQSVLDHNEVDQSKAWARLPESGQKGWVGRWRMNGRQSLEKLVAERGWVKGTDGQSYDVPAPDLADLRSKHQTFLDKKAKAEAKAEAQAA